VTDLVLWRHGETDHNVAGRVQGRVDVPLNATGTAQAVQAARALAALRPSRIVSSPLARARATAQVLAEELGGGTGAAVPVDVVEDLVERSFGAWEGLTRTQIETGWPEAAQVWRAGGDPQGVGVETRAHAAARVGSAIESLMARSGGGGPAPVSSCGPAGPVEGAADQPPGTGPVVVVAHGSAITLGATYLLGADPSAWFGLKGLDNAHWAVLRRSGRVPGWMVVSWNTITCQAGDAGLWTS
jgi:possible phosphoglycerate mutase